MDTPSLLYTDGVDEHQHEDPHSQKVNNIQPEKIYIYHYTPLSNQD